MTRPCHAPCHAGLQLRDNLNPSVNRARATVDQIARSLRAMHQMEMIHQDLKPDNILIDRNNTLKIIDFGSTRIAGLAETQSVLEHKNIVGTASRIFFHWGLWPMKCSPGSCHTETSRPNRLHGRNSHIPPPDCTTPRFRTGWMPRWKKPPIPTPTGAMNSELESEFVADLTGPNLSLLNEGRSRALLERNPLGFWKGLSLIQLADDYNSWLLAADRLTALSSVAD